MRARLRFSEKSDEVLPSLDTELLRLAGCVDLSRSISLQVPEELREARSDIRDLAGLLETLPIHAVTHDGVGDATIDDLLGSIGSEAWWLGDVVFRFSQDDIPILLLAPFADGALVLFASCQPLGDSAIEQISTRASALGYEPG